MSDLPPGWAETKVEELLEKAFDGPFGSNLKSADYRSHGTQVVRLENIGRLRFRNELRTFVSDEKGLQLARHLIESGDVLFASFIDDPIRVCVAPIYLHRKAINKADCFALRASDALMPEFLALQLATAAGAFAERVHGATRPRVGLRDVLQLRIALAPAAEQRRIVAKIDALTARSKRARAELQRVHELADLTRAQVRAELECELEAQVIVPFGELCDELRNGLSRRPEAESPGIPILRISAVRPGRVSLKSERFYRSEPGEDVSRYLLRQDDLLFTRYNGNPSLVGACGRVGEARDPLLYPDKLIRARVNRSRVEPRFIEVFTATRAARDFISRQSKTAAGQWGISGADLKRLPIPLPPLPEQRAIVARIEAAFARIDAVVREAEWAAALLDRLDQAILAKAFRGELVPQDPADEPAAALLVRLATAREAAPKPKRGRRARA